MAPKPPQGKATKLSKEQTRRTFGDRVNRAHYAGEWTVITGLKGEPVAVLVPYESVRELVPAA